MFSAISLHMSKPNTPTMMSKVSNQMKELSQLLKIPALSLNKASEKARSRYGDKPTKGVDSDHIKIFQLQPKRSLGFSFNYASVSTPFVMVTLKVNDNIQSSQYSEDAFKKKLNDFIKILNILKTSNTLNLETAEATFVAQFIKGNEYDPAVAINDAVARITSKIKDINQKHEVKLAKETAEKAEKLKELRKAYEDAQTRVNEIVEKLETQLKMDETEKKSRRLSMELYDYRNEVNNIMIAELVTVPKKDREAVNKRIALLKLVKSD
jgi:hypothetical protein